MLHTQFLYFLYSNKISLLVNIHLWFVCTVSIVCYALVQYIPTQTGADTGFCSGGGQILSGGIFGVPPPASLRGGGKIQGRDFPPEKVQGGDSPLIPPPVSALVHRYT